MKELTDYEQILTTLNRELQNSLTAKPPKFTYARSMRAIRAVLWLHKPKSLQADFDPICEECTANYALNVNWPCETIETVLDGWFMDYTA